MSIALLRTLNRGGVVALNATNNASKQLSPRHIQRANYSRRSDPKNIENSYKVVKSRMRSEENEDFLGMECGPNWELLAPKENRFYFPNAVGPAWQGESSTVFLEVPLEDIVDFNEGESNKAMLKLTVGNCPNLIKKSLHELFPAPEVISAEKLALLTLKYNGDTEQGARKFVLAAREITARLHLRGYWADFMNPFSGKPFYSWANGKNLYKVDDRFRGLNMKLSEQNKCVIISTDDGMETFSGAIYTNAPSDMLQLKSIIDEKV